MSAVPCSLAPFGTELAKLFNVRLNQMANPYESPDVKAATDAPPRPRLRLAFLFASTLLLVASIVWCIATLHSPQRFIFLPGGDVGLGFRSYAGWLQWIEYAPWDINNMDYAPWSVPWAAVIVAISFLVIWQFRSLRRG